MTDKKISPLAIASLAFSCLGAITLGILTIPGIVCGSLAKTQIRRGEYTGYSIAQAGIIVGATVLALWIAIPVLFFGRALFAFVAVKEPWVGLIAVSAILVLVLLPLILSSIARHKDAKILNRIVAENRSRV